MSAVRHFSPGVEITLLKIHFTVATEAIGVLRFPMKSRRFPPTVRQVFSFTALSGFSAHTIFPYVTF